MNLIFYWALIILTVSLILQLSKKIFVRRQKEDLLKGLFKIIFIIAIAGTFLISLYWSISQYFLWRNSGPPTIYLLPPYQKITYFLNYVFRHFWISYLFSLLAALLTFTAARYFNKKHQEVFFEPEESYLMAVSLFLVGHPGWVIYVFFILILGALFSSVNFLMKGKTSRFSLYYLWLTTAIFTIIINKWLIGNLIWLELLKI